MNRESSFVIVTVTAFGRIFCTPASFCFTPSITSIVFWPVARRTSSWTAGAPLSQTALTGRSVVSSA